MGVLADLIALVNGNTEKTLDVLIQEKTTETNGKVDSLDTKVQTGNNLIGATNNTGGTASAGSLFAKLNKLLTDWTTTRAGYLDNINTNVGTLLNGRIVKSVQRGSLAHSEAQIDIPINAVNVSKSIIVLAGQNLSSSSNYMGRFELISSTIIRFTSNTQANTSTAWQVIEFY